MIAFETELIELKVRVERLEETVHQLTGEEQQVAPPEPNQPLKQEELLAWLKAEGLVVDPPPAAHIHAEYWQTMSEEKKQAVRQELDHLPPGPMASDIIIENRR